MSDIASNDSWSEEDSETFIDFGRYYVPEREQQIETICGLIPDVPPPSHVVELCCGEGLLSHALLDRLPNATVHAYDGSPKMLAHTAERLAQFGDRFEIFRAPGGLLELNESLKLDASAPRSEDFYLYRSTTA